MSLPKYKDPVFMENELVWLRTEQTQVEEQIRTHEMQLKHLKLDLETVKTNIAGLERKMVAFRKPISKCSCGKEVPDSRRLVTGNGGVYCLDCGYEILNLLKQRNDAKEEQSYKEFYEDVKASKQNSQL